MFSNLLTINIQFNEFCFIKIVSDWRIPTKHKVHKIQAVYLKLTESQKYCR